MKPDETPLGPQERFPIQLGNLGQKFQDELSEAIGHFAVPLVLDLGNEQKFIGSGTLICFNQHYGVLTAEHVVSYPPNQKYRLDTGITSKQKLRITVADFAHDISIDVRFLEIETTVRLNDYLGPDLAFIKIPVGPLLNELKARKSFVDIAVAPEDRLHNANSEIGCMVVAGFPEVDRVQETSKLGFEVTHGLKGWGFITGREYYDDKSEYDYWGLGVSYVTEINVPLSFGGVSGGGIWQVPIIRKKGTSPGTEFFEKFYLAGVVFFQEEVVDKHCRLRGHGPKSLYEKFFPHLLKQFP